MGVGTGLACPPFFFSLARAPLTSRSRPPLPLPSLSLSSDENPFEADDRIKADANALFAGENTGINFDAYEGGRQRGRGGCFASV